MLSARFLEINGVTPPPKPDPPKPPTEDGRAGPPPKPDPPKPSAGSDAAAFAAAEFGVPVRPDPPKPDPPERTTPGVNVNYGTDSGAPNDPPKPTTPRSASDTPRDRFGW